MPIEVVKVYQLVCYKCRNRWITKPPQIVDGRKNARPVLPVCCPGCKNPNWNKPVVKKGRGKR